MKGRTRKPIEVKVLEGTYRPDRDKKIKVIGTKLAELPPAPSYLNGEGLIFYERYGPNLIQEGKLAGENLPLFIWASFHVQIQAIYKKRILAAETLNDHRTYRKLMDKSEKALRLILAEFGLTPVSVNRAARVVKEEKELSIVDKLDNFNN
jgi:phage terminase small subunit